MSLPARVFWGMGCVSSKDDPSNKGTKLQDNQFSGQPVEANDITLDIGPPAASSKEAKRRVGVSAEATNASDRTYQRVVHAKSAEATRQITVATAASPLFASLGELQYQDVVAAMREVHFQPGDIVIQQGDVGDDFYVVDSGTFTVFLKQKGNVPVMTYEKGGTFGELSLMYNSPRAATVRCEKAGVLWALDRRTFRAILMERNNDVLNTSTQVRSPFR